ncbi:glycosyltransferase family 2 protein [Pseudonocardia parietis]|uniref:Glycosyltransferase involved in cell wall biosynthesis n=1 Tax=Pseudonocardia parietis TaxID=570936 RepID=A0ABS4VVG7_9PSEU|nr:glycosyltransferase family 2 protein [Pseudonocardia parietis]MBP2367907.1 glycosyltransferase involved in cell wall biosynthesis [Pseudonocardia parietis]
MDQARTTVVITTRNRAGELARTLDELSALRPRPPIVVVDDASTDDTAATVTARSGTELVRLPVRRGAAARNAGVDRVHTPYVAFSDDDSWWAPQALCRAEEILDAHPDVGLLAGAVLVGPQNRPDPVNDELAHSPLGGSDPGPDVLGFLGCAAVLRVRAFHHAGGFSTLLGFGAEETLLAADLAARGWRLCHHPEVVAHHHPSPHRMPHERRVALEARNRMLIALMRRRWPRVRAEFGALAGRAVTHGPSRRALGAAVLAAPRALARRAVLPATVEHRFDLLEQ